MLVDALQTLAPSMARLYGEIRRPIARHAPSPDAIDGRDAKQPLWHNMGLWREVSAPTALDHTDWGTRLQAAQHALLDELAAKAELGPDDDVLDCGCGFGDAAMRLLQTHGVRRVTGVDLAPRLLEVGRARARQRGLQGRLALRLASATDLRFAGEARFDVVLALQSAFHFKPRRRFLSEAFRVLTPGGKLVLADMHRQRQHPAGLRAAARRALARHRCGIHRENLYDAATYRRELRAAGFDDIELTSMSAHVFRPFSKVMLLMALDEQGLEPARDELAAAFETIERCPFDELIWARMWDIDEYSLVFARRPPASAGRVRR